MIPILHRDADVIDWIADTAAAALVLMLVPLIRRKQSDRSPVKAGAETSTRRQHLVHRPLVTGW
jgi:hypothetical protein